MIIALWAIPRSISTAFERCMRQRGDLTVFFEPFSDYYYYSTERASKRYMHLPPKQGYTAAETLDRLKEASQLNQVFIKDMAYYVRDCMSESFASNFTNTFLVRHPRYALPSHYRLQPNFTFEEAGYHEQYRLMKLVEATGEKVLVIDGEILRERPAKVLETYCESVGLPYLDHALTWAPGIEPEWEHAKRWVLDAARSSSFQTCSYMDLRPLDIPRIKEIYEQCLPIYESMRSRITVDF